MSGLSFTQRQAVGRGSVAIPLQPSLRYSKSPRAWMASVSLWWLRPASVC
jgi:hypothetical protein